MSLLGGKDLFIKLKGTCQHKEGEILTLELGRYLWKKPINNLRDDGGKQQTLVWE